VPTVWVDDLPTWLPVPPGLGGGKVTGTSNTGLMVGVLYGPNSDESVLWHDGGVLVLSDLIRDAGLEGPAFTVGPTDDGFVGMSFRYTDNRPGSAALLLKFDAIAPH